MNAFVSAVPHMNSGTTYPANNDKLTHSESPLDSLVRKTSSKKLRNHKPHTNHTQKPLIWEPYQPPSHYQAQQRDVVEASSSSANTTTSTTRPSQQKLANLALNLDQSRPSISSDVLHSPLLHSLFPTRDSVLSGASGYDDSFDDGCQLDSLPYDGIDEQRLVGTWRSSSDLPSSGSKGQGFIVNTFANDRSGTMVNRVSDIHLSDFLDYQSDQPNRDRGEDVFELPTVIVSSPDNNPSVLHGRTPVVKPVVANFSRPMRDSGQWRRADAIAERVTPQLPPHMRDQKKAVLERIATRQTTKTSTATPNSIYNPSLLSKELMAGRSSESGLKGLAINSAVGFAVAQPALVSSPFFGSTHPRNGSNLHPYPGSEMRSVSPSSLYSNYSYYQYDGLLPSPLLAGSSNPVRETLPPMTTDNKKPAVGGPQTAQDFLVLGIEHHEANRLQESIRSFERSAKEGGGCGVGMLMYGLSLRHGWGCTKNEALGFKWVRRAAESAVEDLEQLRIGKANIDKGPVQAELVLAIYEVGQCFFHGWGVAKDQKMAFSYYLIAARLGDGDAQGDLAFCFANGKGCKKNKKEAARWYRAAVQQGLSDVGLAWIYKEKYQD